jgi:trigger factor
MSAQIIEKSSEGLSRVFGVTIPANDLTSALEAKVKELAPKMNIKGFRPGKVPAAHVKRMYGKEMMNEIVQETVNSANEKLLNDNKLRPAGTPGLVATSDMEKVFAGEADLVYDLNVELMPEFELVDATKIKLTKPVYEPSDKEIDEAVADLAKNNATYVSRTGKSVKAKSDDQVVIDFVGRLDGVEFEGGKGADYPLVLGSGSFIPGFEDQLIGVKAGETLTVKVKFPDDYQAEELKGKDVEFEVEVKDVKAPLAKEADDELAKSLGIDSLEKLRELIKDNLAQQYANSSRFKLKRALLDQLDEGHSFDLPPRMVEAEFDSIWNQVVADEAKSGRDEEDKDKTEDELKGEYRKIAERRVRLGLVLAEVGRVNNVAISDQEVTQAMQQEAMNMARQYGMQPQEIFDMLRQNPDAAAQIRAPLFEDKVVDLLFTKATVTDKKVTKEELLKDDDLPKGYGG